MTTQLQTAPPKPRSLVEKFAGKYGLEPGRMMATLKATAFKQKGNNAQEISNEQMAALIVVADQYGLNPWTKEIYAYPDKGSIVPVVGVDGWARIVNDHPQLDGIDFNYADEMVVSNEHESCPVWIECVMYRKDRSRPVTVREYFSEVYRPPFKPGMKGPWQSHTNRMMRHKAFIQCARLAFAFTGIHDQDEAERIIEAEYERVDTPAPRQGATTTDRIKATLGLTEQHEAAGEAAEADTPAAEVIDTDTGEVIES